MLDLAFDVVVVGAGLAGIAAAHEAAHAGARVALLADGTLCGGSSFSGRTWGLGMVTPTDLAAERRHAPESLTCAIERVGAHQSKPELVDALVGDGASAVSFLSSIGATVSAPTDPTQRAYVPCFDERVRDWHGFHARESREALARAVLDCDGIQVFVGTTALSLLQPEGTGTPVAGVVAYRLLSAGRGQLVRFVAPSVVLATGGLTGVYAHSFGGAGYLAASMAHDAGARFVNLEFLQLMLAFRSQPYGTICNEKLWRYASVRDEEGVSVFERIGASSKAERAALEAHSEHGPFTTARESRLLELAVQAAQAQGHRAYLHLSESFLKDAHPEFVDTYLDWLRQKGIDPAQPAEITLFAHSSNGGMDIDAEGATSVPGLFAAGECAGGVHGADRIGGLASVAALVFGRRAGVAAARFACNHGMVAGSLCSVSPYLPVNDARTVRFEVGAIMGAHALVNRTEDGLRKALRAIEALQSVRVGIERPAVVEQDPQTVRDAYVARGCVRAAQMLAEAMLRRTESLGSHHRADAERSRTSAAGTA